MDPSKARKYIYITLLFPPLLYLVFLSILWSTTEEGVAGYLIEFLFLLISSLFTWILAVRIIVIRWRQEISLNRFQKDLVILGIYNLPTLLIMFYCVVTL